MQGRCFDEIIALGQSCATRYQLSRERHERARRAGLFTLEQARLDSGYLFDWLISGPAAVTRCFEQDFHGIFDRAQLFIDPDGLVRHRDYGLRFDHAFTTVSGVVRPETLEKEHIAQQAKYEHLVTKFRNTLRSGADLLLVMTGEQDEASVRRLAALIESRRPPDARSHIFSVVSRKEPKGMMFCDAACSMIEIGCEVNKPDAYQWQGDDDVWRRTLRPLTFTLSE